MAKTSHAGFSALQRVDQLSTTSEQDVCSILESVGCAIIGVSPDRRILHCNPEAERLFGYTQDDILGQDYFQLFVPREMQDAVAAGIQQVLGGESSYGFDYSVRLGDGRERDLIWTARRQLDARKRLIGVTVCGQDVTDCDPSRTKPRVAHLALASGMPGISRLDLHGRFLEVNEAYARMLGSEPHEVVGSSWEDTVHVEDRSHAIDACRQMLEKGQADFDARGVRKDGSTFVKRVLLVKICDADDKYVGHHCFMRDVTDEKREEALKAAHERVLNLLCMETPLNGILSDLVRSVEDQIEGIACTVMVLDRQTQTLKLGVGPGLPEGYLQAIDGMPVGPHATPCGVTAYTNQELIIEDILADPRCKAAVPLARKYGLRSCRPMPIRDQDGDVLGVFSLYLTDDRWPSQSEMQWIRAAVSLSGLVIERQRTREILRENEAVFQALAETVQVIPWEMDLRATRFTYVGVQAERILGYEHGSDDWYSASYWSEKVHPDDRERIVQLFQDSIQQKDDFSCDFRAKTSAGQDRWFHNVVHVERVEQQPVKLRGYMIDITSGKQAEETAERTNKLLAALTRAQSQFISDVDPRVLFDELQQNLLALTGSRYGFIGEVLYTAEGRPYLKTQAITNIAWNEETREFYDKHAPQGMEFVNLETLFGAVLKTGKPVITNSPATDARRGGIPDGHPPLESFLGLPFYRGNRLIGMIGMANRPGGYDQPLVEYLEPVLTSCGSIIDAYRNDQRRKSAEAALAEAHENLEKRVRQRTADVMAANVQLQFQAQLLDSVREAVFATDLKGHVNYWGKGAEELYGCAANEVHGKPITFIDMGADEADEVGRLRQVRDRGSWTGERVHQRKDGTSFWSDLFISLVTDAAGVPTGFVGIGRDISDRKEAEEEVQQRQNELAHVSRLSTMGEMATGLAHEINQPLHAIANYAEGALVRMENGDLGAEDLRAVLKQVSTDAARAGEIIRRLRRFVGKYEPRRSTVQLNDLIRQAVKIVEFEANRMGISIHLRLADQLPLLFADSVQIEQVILNLLRNSFQAMEEFPPSERVVEIETLHSIDSEIQVSVRDAGRGFPDVPVERMFEAFFTTKSDGLGMGLAISRSIIEMHRGRLWAVPNPDRGATFMFTLVSSNR